MVFIKEFFIHNGSPTSHVDPNSFFCVKSALIRAYLDIAWIAKNGLFVPFSWLLTEKKQVFLGFQVCSSALFWLQKQQFKKNIWFTILIWEKWASAQAHTKHEADDAQKPICQSQY